MLLNNTVHSSMILNQRLLLNKFKCYGIAPLLQTGLNPFSNGTPKQVPKAPYKKKADALTAFPQGSELGLVLCVIYVNDLADNQTIDHLLYADDVNLITPSPKINVRLPKLVLNDPRTGS